MRNCYNQTVSRVLKANLAMNLDELALNADEVV